MVTTNNNNNRVNLVQVCSLNIEQSRLLQLMSSALHSKIQEARKSEEAQEAQEARKTQEAQGI